MRILVILLFVIGSAAQSQTIEERLPMCIEDADELLLQSKAIKAALETTGQPVQAYQVLTVMFSGEILDMYAQLINEHIKQKSAVSDLERNFDKLETSVEIRYDLIKDMFQEHWDNDKYFSAKADYIAACDNNFDGEVEAQADIIEYLQSLNNDLQKKLTQYENLIEQREDKIVGLENTISSQRENEIRLKTEVITLERELTALNKKMSN